MAAEDQSKGSVGVESKAGEDENRQNPQAPRPKGAPNRFHNIFWLLETQQVSQYLLASSNWKTKAAERNNVNLKYWP